jgi:hypothetical protein
MLTCFCCAFCPTKLCRAERAGQKMQYFSCDLTPAGVARGRYNRQKHSAVRVLERPIAQLRRDSKTFQSLSSVADGPDIIGVLMSREKQFKLRKPGTAFDSVGLQSVCAGCVLEQFVFSCSIALISTLPVGCCCNSHPPASYRARRLALPSCQFSPPTQVMLIRKPIGTYSPKYFRSDDPVVPPTSWTDA